MKQIKLGLAKMSVPQKLVKGADIVAKQTNNPNVPGNTAVLASFSTSQTALQAAVVAALAARDASRHATEVLRLAEIQWNNDATLLASFTETATGGEAVKILTTGFDVRSNPTPPPPLGMVQDLNVTINGQPGHSKVSWKAMPGADGYLVQGSPDPITATSWTVPVVSKKIRFDGNGATAGQKYWYRVAAYNSEEQGPWSEPASRPVM